MYPYSIIIILNNNVSLRTHKSCLDLERKLRGCIFIYSGSGRLISFEINLISKEISRAEPEYMNMHIPINALDPPMIEIGFWQIL